MSGAKALPFTLAQNKGTGEDMKKTVIITLTAVSAIVVIAACGAQPTGSPEYTSATTTAAITDTEGFSGSTADHPYAQHDYHNRRAEAANAAAKTRLHRGRLRRNRRRCAGVCRK
jgi:hypothetical protein